MTGLRAYLRLMVESRRRLGMTPPEGFDYLCVEEFVELRGLRYESQSLTPNERAWLYEMTARKQFPIKECFANSQRLLFDAMYDLPHGWTVQYVEGYLAMADLPIAIHHGWLALNGKVIDLTIRRGKPTKQNRFADRVIGTFTDREYIGVPIDTKTVRQYVAMYREWSSLIDNYRDNFPLLRGVVP